MDLREVRERLVKTAGLVEEYLPSCVKQDNVPERLNASMRYSLLAGGKRLRPVLCLTAAALFGTEPEKVLPFACGIEMIHTYSLIHDDLPAMDNDDMRRGRPSNHKAYDEATAILAGDALQADAFRSMTQCSLPAERVLEALRVFAEAAGSGGMCGGQQLDMDATGKTIALPDLKHLHALKTGAILCASVVCGGILAGAGEDDLRALREYGLNLGVAFQIADDILDVVSDTETLGKPAGSDAAQDKNTYPSLAGLEKSRELAHAHAAKAQDALAPFSGDDADFLRGLALYTVERVN
ncbi:MAG: polyprenyl synthetase family protein [Desulfovibrionaceae bacterium]|nr:polyprenyl synthetase family protein [Desulfovibrionaceae bacterium]